MKLLEMCMPYHDDDCRIIGAGVLPYAIYDRQVWFLLGQEDSDGRYGVFGGRLKAGLTVEETTVMEFYEETLDTVMPRGELEAILRDRAYVLKFAGAAGQNRFFVTYMVQIPWNPTLPQRFLAARQGLAAGALALPGSLEVRDGLPRVKYDFLEKRAMQWFLADEVFEVALRSRWNHPVPGMMGNPMFRRPFLAGLNSLVQYFNVRLFLKDLVWCDPLTHGP